MNKSKFLLRVIMLIVFFICIFGQVKFTFAKANNDKTVYLVVVNKYTLKDIDKMQNLREIINEGSIGLMNTRGRYNYEGPESYLTINASKKAYTIDKGSKVYNLNAKNKEIYERRFGTIFGEYDIVNLNISKNKKYNEKNSYRPYIGALGDNLHNLGLKTAIYGNSDIFNKKLRPSGLIPMDSKGVIDFGNVDDILISDSKYPYGFRTDYEKLILEIEKVKDDVSFVVVDTGDLDRLSYYSKELTDEVFEKHRNNILKNIDEFLGELKKSIDSDNSLLMILSPNRGEERVDQSKLSPLILWGENVDKGICTSSTTKRDGVVANIDIGPTVLKYLGGSKNHMSGNSLAYIAKEDNFDYMTKIQNRINIVSNNRFNILTIYSIIIIIGVILITIVLLLKMKLKGSLFSILRCFLIIIGTLPISFILSSLFNWKNNIGYIITILLISIILILIMHKLKKINLLLLITGLIYFIILFDLITGGNLIRYSALGHDPAIGARYFGLGNELVGLFLGATVVFASIIISISEKNGYHIYCLFYQE